MLNQDVRALETQFRRIRTYLILAVQPCLLRQLDSDWHAAETRDARIRIIETWLRSISSQEVWLFGGDDEPA